MGFDGLSNFAPSLSGSVAEVFFSFGFPWDSKTNVS